jgi:hypothetical protein
MAKILAVTVFVHSSIRSFKAKDWIPAPRMAHHRCRALNDWYRDVEECMMRLQSDGEVSVGFYLEICEDAEINADHLMMRELEAEVLRPARLVFKESVVHPVLGEREVW